MRSRSTSGASTALLLALLLAAGAAGATREQGRPRCPSHEIEVFARTVELSGQQATGRIFWPELSGEGDQEVIERINRSLSYEAVAGETLEETLRNFAETGRGIVGAMFRVNYKHGDLLDITISIDFCGAYPSSFEHYFTFDTRTGELVHARDLFREESLDDLVGVLDDYLQRNISLVALYYGDELEEELDQRFTEEDLDRLSVMIDGVIFRHEFGFPHVSEALEPDGEIFLSFEELEGFIDPEGPLSDPEPETD